MNLDDTLTLEQLSVSFSTDDGILPAVHAVSLSLPPAGITCLVGESGCGKSLTARAILHLLPENAHISGRILFRGRDLRTMPPEEMRALRGRHIAMIFQEPMTSLNPVLKVGMQTAEPLRLHLGLSRSEARQEVIRLFSEVGIPAAESRYDDYPHQLSGGMRQRVMIAMALACKPDLLLADEPTTALDATIQGQILSLITEQSRKRGMAVLFITHDLGVVARIAERGRHVRGTSGGTRSHGRAVPQSSASVYARAHAFRTGTCGHGHAAPARHHRQRPQPGQHARRLPLCPALRRSLAALL